MKKITTSLMSLMVVLGVSCAFGSETEIKLGNPVEATNGFFDLASASYPDGKNVIVIDDKTYKTPKEKRTAFTNAISSGSVKSVTLSDTPAVILVYGTIDLSDGKVSDTDHSYFDEFDSVTHKKSHADFVYPVGSNKTILGMENAKVAYGGLLIKASEYNSAKNIIIRNIAFWDAHGSTDYDTKVSEYSDKKASADQLAIEGTPNKGADGKDTGKMDLVPTNIWIDHCSFSDGVCNDLKRNFNHDGALDAKAVRNMTVSYCEFTNHDKVTLLGPSDRFVYPKDRQITFHHNYYHGTVQRMPRARGCEVHLYNNVYDQIGTDGNSGYSLGPGIGSQFIIEKNTLGSHKGMILRYADKSKPTDETFSRFYINGNVPELNASNSEKFNEHLSKEKPFNIEYKYSLSEVKENEKIVKEQAGATLKIKVKYGMSNK